MALTLREKMWLGDGGTLSTKTPIQYEVVGLPAGQAALIGMMESRWQIIHYKTTGDTAEWHGDFASPEAALAALRTDLSTTTPDG
jgi:hypothetical protein